MPQKLRLGYPKEIFIPIPADEKSHNAVNFVIIIDCCINDSRDKIITDDLNQTISLGKGFIEGRSGLHQCYSRCEFLGFNQPNLNEENVAEMLSLKQLIFYQNITTQYRVYVCIFLKKQAKN